MAEAPLFSGIGAPEKYPSFSRGLFRGRPETGAMFPYPPKDVLTPDQHSTLSLLVDPVSRFFAGESGESAFNAAANMCTT